jgi:putative transposase
MYYHAWFATKERKWLLQGDIEALVMQAIRDTADRHNIRMLECETMVDHVHVLLEVENGVALSRAINLIKGASSRRVMQTVPDIRMDAGINHFWQKRFGSKPVSPDALRTVARYIRTQKDRPEKYER